MTQKLLSDEELRTFYVENCSHEMAGCEYSRLTNIAKRGIDKLVDDILLPAFNTQKRLYAESEEKVIVCSPQWVGEQPAWLCLLLKGDEVLAEKVYTQSQLSSAYYQATEEYADPVIRVGETSIAANYLLRKVLAESED